jgi:hypothetical protein
VRLSRAHNTCARIACAQTAGGANVRLASVLYRCSMGALRVRATSSLEPLAAHRSRRCTPCSSSTRRGSAFLLQLEATHRARAPQWLRVDSTDSDMDIRMDHILASCYSRTLIRCLVVTMLVNITQCAKPMTVTSMNRSMRMYVDKLGKAKYPNDAWSTLLHLALR